MTFEPRIIGLLEASLFRPLVLVATGWLILRLLRVRHPASSHAVWTAVLAGMLLLPILSVVAPDWAWPVLPAAQDIVQQTPDSAEPASIASENPVDLGPLPITSTLETSITQPASVGRPSVDTLIVAAYLVGLLAMLTYRLMGWILFRRVVARSKALRPACLRESSDVVTPVAVGVLRPSVILPIGWRNWNARTKRAVLAHEFAHLRRRDTLVAALARLVKCVFWFHPVAWWVSRQTSDLAELACDAVALQRVGDPAGYSRVLIEFATAITQTRPRVALPGLAIASGSRMGKRIDEVFELSGGTMRKLARPMVWLLALGLPVLCLAATVVPSPSDSPYVQDAPASAGLRLDVVAGDTRSVAAQAGMVKFDVVSIKPCAGLDSPANGRGVSPWAAQLSPGYAHWLCVTLRELVQQAYAGHDSPLLNTIVRGPIFSREANQVRGGPPWLDSDRFAIEIKLAGETARPDLTGAALLIARRNAINPALRAMIEDRFQLKIRKLTEQAPMYALTLGKSGLKVPPAVPNSCSDAIRLQGMAVSFTNSGRGNGRAAQAEATEGKPPCGVGFGPTLPNDPGIRIILGRNATLKELATALSSWMDRHVLDKTGVEGTFTFSARYATDEHTSGSLPPRAGAPAPLQRGNGPSIFAALEALGLKLEPTKGPAEYFVIDSVQKPRPDGPSEIRQPSARVAGPGRRGR